MDSFVSRLYVAAALACAVSAGCATDEHSQTAGSSILDEPQCPQELYGFDCFPQDTCGNGYCDPSESCSSCELDCGPCYDPNIINVPGTPQQADASDVYALAQQLGVPPIMAGVPNIATYLETPQPVAFAYPLGAQSLQDFMNQLFQSGIWANTAPGQTDTPLAPDANGCQLKQVDAHYNPEELVSFDFGAGLLYPGSLVQGAYVNLGIGSLTPIHIPYTQRNPVSLASTFFSSRTAPTATSTDIYGAIGDMVQSAQAAGGITQSTVYFEQTTASSLEEAATKFKLDAKLFGGTIGATFSSVGSTQSNTVFVKYTQSLFAVFQDLRGFTPTQAEINSAAMPVSDLENLGATGELAYNNLPAYVRAVTYGRMLLFSVTSTSSKSELEEAINAVYGKFSASASASQKKTIQDSQIRVFAYGGPAEPQIATIKSGNWQDYFTLVNVPIATLKPLGYEVRRFDDQLATMSRTTSFTERTCPGAHKVRVQLSDVYKRGKISIQKTGSTSFEQVLSTESFANIEINQFLVGSQDQIKIAADVDHEGIFDASHSHMQLTIFVDDVPVVQEWYSCNHCHSRDPVWVYKVDQFSGAVTQLQGP